jgi:broad specificity phosphatase PhoE
VTARIVLVRHAEPARRARGRAIGRTDIGLSREGARQARELASKLGVSGVDRVVSSPAARALRTAASVVRACGVPLEVEDDLREIDFGALDGRTFASIQREYPQLYATWMRAPTTVIFPDGETWGTLRKRSEGAIERIAARGEGQTTVVITHLGVMLATLGRVLSVADEDVFRQTIEHTQTYTLEVDKGAWIVHPVRAPP